MLSIETRLFKLAQQGRITITHRETKRTSKWCITIRPYALRGVTVSAADYTLADALQSVELRLGAL